MIVFMMVEEINNVHRILFLKGFMSKCMLMSIRVSLVFVHFFNICFTVSSLEYISHISWFFFHLKIEA